MNSVKPITEATPVLLNQRDRRVTNELASIFTQCRNYSIVRENDTDFVRINHNGHEYSMVLDSLYPFTPFLI